MEYCLPVVLIAFFFLLAGAARATEGSWICPPSFYAILWGAYIAASLPFAREPETLVPGIAWILFSCVWIYVGCLASERFLVASANDESCRSSRLRVLPGLTAVTVVLSALGIIEIAQIFFFRGFSLSAIFDFASAAAVSGSNRIDFGYGDARQGPGEWLLIMSMYANALFGGVLSRSALRLRLKALGCLPLVLVAYGGTLYGSRMGVLFGGAFWLASYLSAHILRHGCAKDADFAFLLRIGVLALVIVVGFSLVAMGVRYYYLANDRDILLDLSESFVFVRAFCVWFRTEGLADRDLLWGFRTFWKTYECLGVQQDLEPAILVEETSSNIYTAFRGLIEDFGPLGSCVVMFVLGFAGSIGYRNVVAGRASWQPMLIIVFAYGLVGTSFSLFTYNAPNLAMALFCGYFLMRTVFPGAGVARSRGVAG